MSTIRECHRECPRRCEGCHTTCTAGIAEGLVNWIASDRIAKQRREKWENNEAMFKLAMKRRKKKVAER